MLGHGLLCLVLRRSRIACQKFGVKCLCPCALRLRMAAGSCLALGADRISDHHLTDQQVMKEPPALIEEPDQQNEGPQDRDCDPKHADPSWLAPGHGCSSPDSLKEMEDRLTWHKRAFFRRVCGGIGPLRPFSPGRLDCELCPSPWRISRRRAERSQGRCCAPRCCPRPGCRR